MVASIPLGKLFTAKEIDRATNIIKHNHGEKMIAMVIEHVIQPKMDHIDFVTGQENHPPYFAWVLVHTLRYEI